MNTIRQLVGNSRVSLTHRNHGGKTALMNAARYGNLELVLLLLSKPEVASIIDVQDANGKTALFKAARHGHTEIVRHLLEAGADPYLSEKNGTTALMYAAYYGYVAIAKGLLAAARIKDRSRYANYINAQDPYLMSALMISVDIEKGGLVIPWQLSPEKVEIANLLLDQPEINVNLENKNGSTAMMIGIESLGLEPIFQKMITRGANVNHRRKDGKNILMIIASSSVIIVRINFKIIRCQVISPDVLQYIFYICFLSLFSKNMVFIPIKDFIIF